MRIEVVNQGRAMGSEVKLCEKKRKKKTPKNYYGADA
jgi:hypothetical protein